MSGSRSQDPRPSSSSSQGPIEKSTSSSEISIPNTANTNPEPGSSTERLQDAPEFKVLSLYEQKSLLVNAEFDAMGMGRYQWYIWGLCGLGYFLDLLWAMAYGLIASPLQQELGFSSRELGDIFIAFNSGLCAGAFVWGVLVDIVGRRWAFNGTVFLTSAFGICLGAPSTYTGILILTALNGFGIGGNIPIDTTICLEFLPQNKRFLLALLSIFQPLGVVVCCGIAYGFIPTYSCAADLPSCLSPSLETGTACCSKADNWGWRYLMFTLGGISLFVFIMRFVVFSFQESPKFLIAKGRDEDAIEVLLHVSRFNGHECRLGLDDFRALDEDARREDRKGDVEIVSKDLGWREKIKCELARMRVLFSTRTLARLTIFVWIIYAFDYWAFSIAGAFLPIILLRKNAAIHVSLSQTYLSYIIIYLPGLLGVLLSTLLIPIPRLGRKIALLLSSALMGVSLMLLTTVNTYARNVGQAAMVYFFQSMFNAVLYGWTPEAFPASVRGTASGVASFWGRVASIVAPIVGARLLEGSLDAPLWAAGAGAFVCMFAVLGVPGGSLMGVGL